MRILYNNREFEIVSVLDLNERHEELQIIAAERNAQTAQNFDKGEYNGEEWRNIRIWGLAKGF